jgi:hypothetical protein
MKHIGMVIFLKFFKVFKIYRLYQKIIKGQFVNIHKDMVNYVLIQQLITCVELCQRVSYKIYQL